MIFLIVPVIKINNASEFIRFLSIGEDNASHFSMLNRNIKVQSLPYLDTKDTGLISTLNIYPQGISSFFSYFIWTVIGDKSLSLLNLIRYYYFILSMLASSLVFITVFIIYRHSHRDYNIVGSILGSILVFIGSVIFLVGWGFLTQISALVFLFILYYLFVFINSNSEKTQTCFLL